MNTAELFLQREVESLSPYAFLTRNTKGRLKVAADDARGEYRTDFQRDRDRIIHCKSFRRLMHKTQVFFSPADEHYRTRMTHTLEVAQISRIIARALRLNEDLTEAIAMGHDLGHTPFGHEGEMAMRHCFDSTFAHYEQSLRVVDLLERDGAGLNLTYEVRDGILNHSGQNQAVTLEGRIVKIADRIAYLNSDIDDAIRAGILLPEDIPCELSAVLGDGYSTRINAMVRNVIESSFEQPDICMTGEVEEATLELRDFLMKNVYRGSAAKRDEGKAQYLLIRLFEYFRDHPEEMPPLYVRNISRDGVARCVCDFISGMTDRYAIERYEELFIPRVWRGNSVRRVAESADLTLI